MEIDDAQVRTIQIIHTMVKQIDQLEKRFKESSKNKTQKVKLYRLPISRGIQHSETLK